MKKSSKELQKTKKVITRKGRTPLKNEAIFRHQNASRGAYLMIHVNAIRRLEQNGVDVIYGTRFSWDFDPATQSLLMKIDPKGPLFCGKGGSTQRSVRIANKDLLDTFEKPCNLSIGFADNCDFLLRPVDVSGRPEKYHTVKPKIEGKIATVEIPASDIIADEYRMYWRNGRLVFVPGREESSRT